MKKLTYLILLGLIVSSCNKPEKITKETTKINYVVIKYFDNTLDTLQILGYEGIQNDLNLNKGDLYLSNPYRYTYASQVKTYKILKQ